MPGAGLKTISLRDKKKRWVEKEPFGWVSFDLCTEQTGFNVYVRVLLVVELDRLTVCIFI